MSEGESQRGRITRRAVALAGLTSFLAGCGIGRGKDAAATTEPAREIRSSLHVRQEIPDGVVVAEAASSDPDKAPFRWVIGGSQFGETFDSVSYFGYNVDNKGGQLQRGEPTFAFCIEQDYVQMNQHTLEAYFDFTSSDASVRYRPLFWQFSRETGALNAFVFTGSLFTFSEPGAPFVAGPTVLELSRGLLKLAGSDQRTTQLRVGASAGNGSVFSLSHDDKTAFSISAPIADRVEMRAGDTEVTFLGDGRLSFGPAEPEDATVTVGTSGVRSALRLVAARAQQAPVLTVLGEHGEVTLSVSGEGAVESAASGGLILTSPAGRRFRLTVTDGGELKAVAA